MTAAAERSAINSAVVGATQGLISYLRDLVRASHFQVRELSKYEVVVPLGELPEGVTARREPDEIILRLPYEAPPLRPDPPDLLRDQLVS